MSDQARDNIIQVRKLKNKADADAAREKTLQVFLYRVLDTLKQQSNLTAQVNSGLLQFEAFIDALMSGGTYPSLESWVQRRSGTPPGDAGELRARRLIVLASIALERSGMSMAEARRFVARETNTAKVFPGEIITVKALEHWAERLQPALGPGDEQVIATAIASVGLNAAHRLATYFIGLAHFAHNPSAMIVKEDNF